ncbi:MAG: ThiF family adenylyltransferase [Lachnospiraceae bacterium]
MASFARYVSNGFNMVTNGFFGSSVEEEGKEATEKIKSKNKRVVKKVDKNFEHYSIDEDILDEMRTNVGKYPAETGGMIGSTSNLKRIDLFYFDSDSANSAGSFYYNIEKVSKVNNAWKDRGYVPTGFIHSHPIGMVTPSFHDVATAKLHMDFWNHNFFTMPIVQAKKNGFFELYFYVAYREETLVRVNCEVVIRATKEGYEYEYDRTWSKAFNNTILDKENGLLSRDNNSRKSRKEVKKSIRNMDVETINLTEKGGVTDAHEYEELFKKVSIPNIVRNKVIVCVGGGGSRGFLADMARHGFMKFVIFDGDVVSESNIATQQVYVSEIGKKKVEVIKTEIQNINPKAEVITIDRFLDENMSDEEFMSYLRKFKVRTNKDYLLLGCTDSFDAQSRTAYLAMKYGMMYEAAMMYKNGAGAELIFTYPKVTPCCPRCLLRKRFEDYENGYRNDVDSSHCTYYATEVMNAYKGYIALMMLMYHDAPGDEYNDLLDQVKNRNFVWIRLSPNIKDILGIGLFDKVFEGTEKYMFMGENLWIPQIPDSDTNGTENCRMCGGTGNLSSLYMKWKDTREVAYEYKKGKEDIKLIDEKLIDPSKRKIVGGRFDASV